MGYLFYKQKELSIFYSKDYKKAVFGIYHAAFLNNDDEYIFSIEDKDSIINSYRFYNEFIIKNKTFPIFDGEVFLNKESNSLFVLKQVLGIPDCVFDSLDLSTDLVSQLKFESNLSTIKRDCYIQINCDLNKKYFIDDFKMYCVNNGLFFIYDETKPFVESDNILFPVYILEDLLDEPLKKLYIESTSDRFAIDFLGYEYDSNFVKMMKAFDSFSLNRRISYFVNSSYDKTLSNINNDPIFIKKYARILRQYIACLVNTLYDRYSFEKLNKLTVKTSYLTINKIYVHQELYNISSFHCDMYSFDKVKFFFASFDKASIYQDACNLISIYGNNDILEIYTRLSLPYYGYKYVKELKEFTADDIVSLLPFNDSISTSDIYLSAKRFDLYYSYLSSEKEHRHVFLNRFLLLQGVCVYPIKAIFNKLYDKKITIINNNSEKKFESLDKLFNKKTYLGKEIYFSYCLSLNMENDMYLLNSLSIIDSRSNGDAVKKFYSLFNNKSLNEVIDSFLSYYDLLELKNDDLVSFFYYLLTYLYSVAESDYRIFCLKDEDVFSLLALDKKNDENESFEPNMVFPYVSHGKIFYSFKETFYSEPYLCSCQKEALEKRFKHLYLVYSKRYPKENLENDSNYLKRMNILIVDELGLPKNIVHDLDLSLEILPQIKYHPHICHVCLKSIPSIHDNIDDKVSEPHNYYLSYIKSNANKNGFYVKELISMSPCLNDFFDEINNGCFHTLFDIENIPDILKPYLNIDKTMLASLICTSYFIEIGFNDFAYQVNSFLSLDISIIKKMMFDFSDDMYPLLTKNIVVFAHFYFIYKCLEIAYALYLSQDIVSSEFYNYCLGYDYNKNLPYPYVILGNRFNAYTDNILSNKFYFCLCDKDIIKKMLIEASKNYDNLGISRDIKTPFVLALVGLPYLVIYKYRNYDFSTHSYDEFVDQLEFKESICRRCTHINHAANNQMFFKFLPNRDDYQAEYNFISNSMAKDGILLINEEPLSSFNISSEYKFDISSYSDPKLPCIYYLSSHRPQSIYESFKPSKDTIKEDLINIQKKEKINLEVFASASGIIMDTYLQNENVFINFIENLYDDKTLKELVSTYFPEISRIRESMIKEVIEMILFYIHYLYEKLINYYLQKERNIKE